VSVAAASGSGATRPSPERRRVLITHADEPLGRRLVKRLFHDEAVESILAVGSGPPPRSFDHFLSNSGGRLRYARVDLARHRPVAELFHSASLRSGAIDSVIHVPRHGPAEEPVRPIVAGVAERTAEARLVLQQCLQTRSIRSLIVLGSAFIYRLPPGNANRLTEESELNLDPDAPAELRSWVDCDMIFHGEVHNHSLRVVLLRVPTVVASGGALFLNPSIASADRHGWLGGLRADLRPLGYDPICALVCDKDVAAAARQALHADGSGVYNVAGHEALPLSLLSSWTGRWNLPVPGSLLGPLSRLARLAGSEALATSLDSPMLRHGFTLDTTRAQQELDFRPGYRIGLARAGDGQLRIETAPV
jgi:nucleoside-diphosphate-sugar epimerase